MMQRNRSTLPQIGSTLPPLKLSDSAVAPDQLRQFHEFVSLLFQVFFYLQFQGIQACSEITATSNTSIPKLLFLKFTRLPFLTASSFYWAIVSPESQQNQVIELTQFSKAFSTLLFGSTQQKLELVFRILQRGHTERDALHQEDCLLILRELAIASGFLISGTQTYEARSKRFEEKLDSAVNSLFTHLQSIAHPSKCVTLTDFINFALYHESDIPLMVLSSIYDSIRLLERFMYFSNPKTSLSSHNGIGNYGHRAKCSRVESLRTYRLDGLAKVHFVKEFSALRRLIDGGEKYSQNLVQELGRGLVVEEEEEKKADISYNYYSSNREQLRRKKAQQVWHVGLMHRLIDDSHIRAFWFEIRDNDLYYFDKKSEAFPMMILPLSLGFTIHENPDDVVQVKQNEKSLFSFELVESTGSNSFQFFFFDRLLMIEWQSIFESIIKTSELHLQQKVFEMISEEERVAVTKDEENEKQASITQKVKMKKEQQQNTQFAEYCRLQLFKIASSHSLITPHRSVSESGSSTLVSTNEEFINLPEYLKAKNGSLLDHKTVREIIAQLVDLLVFGRKVGLSFKDVGLSCFSIRLKEKLSAQLRLTSLNKVYRISQEPWEQEENMKQMGRIAACLVLSNLNFQHSVSMLEDTNFSLSQDAEQVELKDQK